MIISSNGIVTIGSTVGDGRFTINGISDIIQSKIKSHTSQTQDNFRTADSSDVPKVRILGSHVLKTVGRQQAVRTVTASTTMTVADEVIEFNSASAIAQTLIAATGTGARYSLVNRGAGRVTFTRASSDLIDGEISQYIDQYEGITIHDVAAGIWRIC